MDNLLKEIKIHDYIKERITNVDWNDLEEIEFIRKIAIKIYASKWEYEKSFSEENKKDASKFINRDELIIDVLENVVIKDLLQEISIYQAITYFLEAKLNKLYSDLTCHED